MALTLDELAWCFSGLCTEFLLLLANPTKPGDGIGACNIQPRGTRSSEGDPPIGRMNGEMDVLDGLSGDQNTNFSYLNRFVHP
jgi:hypothetical protein